MKKNSPATVKQWAKVKKHEAAEKKSGHEKTEKAMEKAGKYPVKKPMAKKKGK
jgi:hypothetical protein